MVLFLGDTMSGLDSLMIAALSLANFAAEISAKAWSSDLAVDYKSDGIDTREAALITRRAKGGRGHANLFSC